MKKTRRSIITIEEKLCDGCGNCITACPEQAIQLVDTPSGKKARLVKEFYCDGLGACIGGCPTGALKVEEKLVEPYDEKAVVARIKEKAPEKLEEHLEHHRKHAQGGHSGSACGCPSAQTMQWEGEKGPATATIPSALRQWPVQLHLVSPDAPYFKGAVLTVVADCVPFAYANFHRDFLRDTAIAVGCPKLDDADAYVDKLAEIISSSNPQSIKVVHMEVPCCFGLSAIVKDALGKAKKKLPMEDVTITIKGDIK